MKRNVVKGILNWMMAIAIVIGVAGKTQLHVEAATNVQPDILNAQIIKEVEFDAQSNARTMLDNCIISVSCSEAGMHIDILTGAVGTASVIGVKDVVIMKKVWYGWKTVATSAGAEDYNRLSFGVSIDYANAEYDETYRITCVHYADVNSYIEGENDTGAFVFTY